MKDHPLFNDDPNDTERRSRNIDFINVHQWINGKKQTLHMQWEPEDLLTIADVYAAVGEGHFELVGRENEKKRVVDRTALIIKPPRSNGQSAAPNGTATQPQQPGAPAAPAAPAVPVMNLGNIQIPPNMDPNMVMMLVMLNTQQQQSDAAQRSHQAQIAAQREDSRLFMQAQTQLMIGLANSSAQMLTGLIQGIGSFIPKGAAGSEGTAEAFIKGIETMTELHAGIKEGQDAGKPMDWNTVSGNIVAGIKTLKEVAALSNAPPVAAAGPAT